MEWHIFKCVQNKDNSGKFLINFQLTKTVLEINIVQNTVAWSAEIQQDMIKAAAQKLKMDPSDYLKRLKEYLNSDKVEFKFTKNEFVLQCLMSQNIKVNYLQCKLSKVQSIFESVNNLLQTMYNEKNSAIRAMDSSKEETDHLRKSTMDLECKLNEFISRKKKEEDILYSNFALVLNEKKAQIQHLTEMLEAFRHGRPTTNPQPKINEKANKVQTPKVEVKNEISESDSEESEVDYNTDDELRSNKITENSDKKGDEEISKISKEKMPTTSKQHSFSSFLNDSPPPTYLLPKRAKNYEKTDDIVSVTTYNTDSSKNNTRQEEESAENSPCDFYDTQDLLDHI